jgi:hypothetical protein
MANAFITIDASPPSTLNTTSLIVGVVVRDFCAESDGMVALETERVCVGATFIDDVGVCVPTEPLRLAVRSVGLKAVDIVALMPISWQQ